jgi:hypothetical protein
MPWKPGQSGNPFGRLPEKLFADQLRIVLCEEDKVTGRRKMRVIAEKLVEQAMAGEGWAIQQVADRIDGKPAQESTVTIEHKRNATDWTRAELVAFLNDALAGSKRVAETDGSDREADSIH